MKAEILSIVCIFSSLSLAQEASADELQLAALQSVSSSNLQFTSSIFEILSRSEGNVIFSPTSVQTILALTYLAARGETAQQMSRGLHLPDDDELVTRGFHALISSLESDDNITLEIANKIVTDMEVPLKKEFQDIAETSFLSEVEAVDFKTNHEEARLQINQWVEENTHHKIKDLLAEGVITSDTVFVLVNALYFKGEWVNKFENFDTYTSQFFVTPEETKEVQMMFLDEDKFGYTLSEELDCKVLEMQYKGDRVSMFVLLPNTKDGLADLESQLPSVNLNQLLDNLEMQKLSVHLPSFKIEQSTELNEVLEELGMVDMFQGTANFEGLTDKPVQVSKVVHKAFLEVNEEGSEGAAATAMSISFRMGPMRPEIIFRADHPFLFFIREKSTKAVLFMGRVHSP